MPATLDLRTSSDELHEAQDEIKRLRLWLRLADNQLAIAEAAIPLGTAMRADAVLSTSRFRGLLARVLS